MRIFPLLYSLPYVLSFPYVLGRTNHFYTPNAFKIIARDCDIIISRVKKVNSRRIRKFIRLLLIVRIKQRNTLQYSPSLPSLPQIYLDWQLSQIGFVFFIRIIAASFSQCFYRFLNFFYGVQTRVGFPLLNILYG